MRKLLIPHKDPTLVSNQGPYSQYLDSSAASRKETPFKTQITITRWRSWSSSRSHISEVPKLLYAFPWHVRPFISSWGVR